MSNNQVRISICLALFIIAFHFYSSIILPFVFSLIVALAMLQPCQWLESKGIPRGISSFIVVLIPVVFIVTAGSLFYFQVEDFVASLPEIGSKGEAAVEDITREMDESLDTNLETSFSEWEMNVGSMLKSGSTYLSDTLVAFQSILSFLVVIPVYMFFILFSRNYLKKFVISQFENPIRFRIMEFFSDAKRGMMGYFKGLGFVIIFVAILNSLGLWAIGINYPVLLGTISAFLIVIPYVGVAVGALLPMAVAFLTQDGYISIVLVALLYGSVQFIEGNIITPKLMSQTIDLNPLAIILFLVFMGFTGGILGMALAVPILALIKIGLEHSKAYKSWAILLSAKD